MLHGDVFWRVSVLQAQPDEFVLFSWLGAKNSDCPPTGAGAGEPLGVFVEPVDALGVPEPLWFICSGIEPVLLCPVPGS